jgi:hypothetical protein
MMRLGLMLLTVTMLATACAPRASEGGFDSDNPASRLYAIRRAGDQRDAAATPRLIESLESDDPAERVLAIAALERITGERLGYDPHASLAHRHEAVQRWWQYHAETTAKP